jgi:hypothetical protein
MYVKDKKTPKKKEKVVESEGMEENVTKSI